MSGLFKFISEFHQALCVRCCERRRYTHNLISHKCLMIKIYLRLPIFQFALIRVFLSDLPRDLYADNIYDDDVILEPNVAQ